MKESKRCAWCLSEPIYQDYHDKEWGKPVYDRNKLFEMLCLEGAQAGLSWITILKKRENYRAAFENFDPEKIALYGEKEVSSLLLNSGIVRHRGKIESVIWNAKAVLKMEAEGTPFSDFVWKYVDGNVVDHKAEKISDLPAQDEISKKMSRDFKKRGFKFVGPTTCYSFMQAAGLINDHILSCDFR